MEKEFSLKISADDPDVAYLVLPGHPGSGVAGAVSRQIRLSDLLQYKGADIYIDLDEAGVVIGIEVLV
ncbi:MAG: DUF2283 domain-containing protein [Pelomonas sp.]|nr:DUF2283 domain-containing protein [Roseateles sp.]